MSFWKNTFRKKKALGQVYLRILVSNPLLLLIVRKPLKQKILAEKEYKGNAEFSAPEQGVNVLDPDSYSLATRLIFRLVLQLEYSSKRFGRKGFPWRKSQSYWRTPDFLSFPAVN